MHTPTSLLKMMLYDEYLQLSNTCSIVWKQVFYYIGPKHILYIAQGTCFRVIAMLVITIHNTSQLLFVKTIKTKPIVLPPILVCDVLSSFDGSDIPI